MSDKWLPYYVYGEHSELLDWLVATWPSDDPNCLKPYTVPHTAAFRGNYLLPQRKTGTATDDYGIESDIYEPIPGRSDILCLIAVTDPSIFDTVPGTFHQCTKEEVAVLYPEHALRQTVPYII